MLSEMERTVTNKLTCKFSGLNPRKEFFIDARNYRDLYEKKTLCPPVTLEWSSIQILVILQVFKLHFILAVARTLEIMGHVTNCCKRPICMREK